MQQFDYAKEFGSAYHAARSLPTGTERWLAEIRAEKLQQWILPTDQVLEYGVGFGWNLAALRCARKVGFDLTPDLREKVEANGIRFEASEKSLPQRSYDVVLLHHVLEHIWNPFFCLKKLRGLLAENGRLLLFVPFERERKYQTFFAVNRAHHLYSWTPASLSRLLIRSGFAIEEMRIQPFRFDRLAAVVAKQIGGGPRLYRWLRRIGVSLLPEFELCFVARLQERLETR